MREGLVNRKERCYFKQGSSLTFVGSDILFRLPHFFERISCSFYIRF